MALALEIAFAAAIGIVALSLLAVVLGKASDRLLLIVTVALAAGAAIGTLDKDDERVSHPRRRRSSRGLGSAATPSGRTRDGRIRSAADETKASRGVK